MLRAAVLMVAVGGGYVSAVAQERAEPLMLRVARTAEKRWPDGDTRDQRRPYLWNYTRSVVLMGFERAAEASAEPDLYDYVRKATEQVVNADGTIRD